MMGVQCQEYSYPKGRMGIDIQLHRLAPKGLVQISVNTLLMISQVKHTYSLRLLAQAGWSYPGRTDNETVTTGFDFI